MYLFVPRTFLLNVFTHLLPLLKTPSEAFPDVGLKSLNLLQVVLVLLDLPVTERHLVEEGLHVDPEQSVRHVWLHGHDADFLDVSDR